MSAKIFLDTNVLVYAYSGGEPAKQARAIEIGTGAERWISTQVLIEFVNVSHRKLKTPWPDIQTALIELADSHLTAQTTPATIAQATRLAHRYQLAWFDSLIVAAALDCGCETLYSEDFSAGQRFEEQLTVVNPFKG